MASCDQASPRKRTLEDPSASAGTHAKQPRIASAFSSPTTAPRSSFHSPKLASGTAPAASSPDNTLRNPSDPFPRYSLGIPHLNALLPLREGLDLLHAYHQAIGWIYTPVDRTTLLETLEEAERHGTDSIHPHRLACLLAALALGDLFSSCFPSSSLPPSGSSSSSIGLADTPTKRGRIWFGVASACLAGSPNNVELLHNPTPDACSALYLMSTYLLCSNDEELFHRSQGLTGLALVLAKTALLPSCAVSSRLQTSCHMAAPSIASQHQAAADLRSGPAASSSAAPVASAMTDQDRLHSNRLLSDLIFHLRCQTLTFAQPCSVASQSNSPQSGASLASLLEIPTIQAIWTAFGTPLYPCLDAFGSCYSPNVFHNWKLGLADLMHQVSFLTNQTTLLGSGTPCSQASCSLGASKSTDKLSEQRKGDRSIALPDHDQIVKLDERIRRYHASLPGFLLLHKPLPIEMAGKVDEDELAQIICQRHLACSMVHRMLMALHRPWFLSALASRSNAAKAETKSPLLPGSVDLEASVEAQEPDGASLGPPSPPAMFSLSAVLRSATWQTETFASATACAPPQALAWWQFTNNALAAAIVQATALLRLSCPLQSTQATASNPSTAAHQAGSASHFHTQVRSDLDKNVCSFQNVAKRCKLAAKALPFLQRVSSAIDSGICKSRSTRSSGDDSLQRTEAYDSPLRPQPAVTPSTPSESSTLSTSSALAPTQPNTISHRHPSSPNCNNTSIAFSHSHSHSHSNRNSNSSIRSNSNSNSINSNFPSNKNVANSTNGVNIDVTTHAHIEPHTDIPQETLASNRPQTSGSRIPAAPDSRPQRPSAEASRASSAKSELETIFGPIASGLELSGAPMPQNSTVKPTYRQNWEPLLVAPTGREGDEQSSQPPSSDDAGSSSCSSATFPRTPRSTSPRLNAVSQASTGPTAAAEGKATESKVPTERVDESKKKQSQASDLVLECIRFWQPDMLSFASPDDS